MNDTTNTTSLRGLPAKWREEADRNAPRLLHPDACDALCEAADELEAALSPPALDAPVVAPVAWMVACPKGVLPARTGSPARFVTFDKTAADYWRGTGRREVSALYATPTPPHPDGVAAQAVTDEMVEAYVEAVNEHLGNLTPKQWEIERFDHAASIRKVARIGLTAALAHPNAAPCDAQGASNG